VEKVIALFSFVAEEVREILAQLGFARLNDIVGRVDLLAQVNRGSEDLVDLDLNTLLAMADPGSNARHCTLEGRNEVPQTLDAAIIADAGAALERGERMELAYEVKNTLRSIGARLSSVMTRRFDCAALPADHVTLRLHGSAGQSLGAFLVRGITIELTGDANDYVGKGLSGGTIIVRPRPQSARAPHENTIIGNTVLYGATAGALFASGQAGERFAVRNSGARTVAEGCGANACEYMTGGMAVILGAVGHNFAAGMTGGMSFVYDAEEHFTHRVNADSVVYQRVESAYWEERLRALIEEHRDATASPRAEAILSAWERELPRFWQICPKEMVSRLEQPLSDAAPHARRA